MEQTKAVTETEPNQRVLDLKEDYIQLCRRKIMWSQRVLEEHLKDSWESNENPSERKKDVIPIDKTHTAFLDLIWAHQKSKERLSYI